MVAGKRREGPERLVEPVPLLGLSLGDVLLGLMGTGRHRPEPAPAGQGSALDGVTRAAPFCADESCHTSEGPDALVGRYDYVNLKLGKTDGLTEALRAAAKAEELGFGLM